MAEIEGYQRIIDGARQVVEAYKPQIPIDPAWEMVALGEVADFRNGLNYTKESKGETLKILGVKDFQSHFYAPFNAFESVQIDGKLSDSDLLKKDDIVFVRSNGNQNLIGRCVMINGINERAAHSGFTIRMRLRNEQVDPKFCAYLLRTDAIHQQMIDGGAGANIKSLSQGVLSSLQIPLPPLETQQRIVATIEREQVLVNANKELIQLFGQKIKDRIAAVWGRADGPEPDKIDSINPTDKQISPLSAYVEEVA